MDTTPPLSNDDLELMLRCVRAVSESDVNPNSSQFYQRTNYLTSVGTELKRAKRDTDSLIEELATRQRDADLGVACTLAASEHRVDKSLELFDKWSKKLLLEQAKANRSRPQYRWDGTTNAMFKLMGYCAYEKANENILRIMDRLLDHSYAMATASRAEPKRNSAGNSRNLNQQQGFQTWYGEQQNYVQIDYPPPNDYLNFNGLCALRQAYESFKRNDVVSDLVPHLKRRAERAVGTDKLAARQAIGAVLWWNDEKEEASAQFVAAAELAPQDQSLKLDLASMHFAMSDFDTALDVVDRIVPRDQKLLQTREMMALQFAERLGDADRARTAAERLFGVRLDSQVQIALAGHMRRLGLNELAEALTSRAERTSGNQLNALITLMTLYQGQGKTKEASQLAHQILRRTTPSSGNTGGRRIRNINQNDDYRQQALQFLAQTGQLSEMITRLEKARSGSEWTPRMSSQLAELYTSSGKRDKALELFAELVKKHPEDAAAHFQYGQQLEQAGKAAEACDEYIFVLKQRPELMSDDFYRYAQIFQQANKSRALAEAMETMNLKVAFRQPYNVMNIAQNLLQRPESREFGVKLFRRVAQDFPAERGYLFQYIHNDEVWSMPEIFELAKQSFVPSKALSVVRPWQGLENIYSYDQNGRVNSTVSRVLDSAKKLNRLEELRTQIVERLQGTSDWPAGRAILALIDVKEGKKDEAEKKLTELIRDETAMKTLPAAGKWIIAQEIDGIADLQPRAIVLLTEAAADYNRNNDFQYTPYNRLVQLYKTTNRRDDALKTMRDILKQKSGNEYDQDYAKYRHINSMLTLADQFMNFEAPIDAIRLYRTLLSAPADFAVAARYGGNDVTQIKRRCENGMTRALAAMQGDRSTEGFRMLLSNADNSARVGPVVDLMIGTPDVQDLSKSILKSAFVDLMQSLSSKPELQTSVDRQLDQLLQEQPNDLSLSITRCLLGFQHDSASFQSAIENLARLVDEQPLDVIDAGKRPNSRQRTQALQQIPLWLVARKCLEQPSFAPIGEKLATRALIAAKRQIDFNFTVSILHEWGQIEWKRGEHDAAEQHWSDLLDAATVRPKSERKNAPASAPVPVPRNAPPTPRRVGQIEQPPASKLVSANRAVVQQAVATAAPQAVEVRPEAKRNQAAAPASVPEISIPPLTYPQFHSAISVAKLAAEHRLQKLSFRAVDEALKAGPPIQISIDGQGIGIMSSPGAGRMTVGRGPAARRAGQIGDTSGVTPESFALVARSLRSLATVWEINQFPPDAVYALLLPHLLPATPPNEIKVYLEDDGLISGRSTSLAATIIPWAQRAHKTDDLKQQITLRSEHPPSSLNGQVFLALIALREQDDPGVKTTLQKIAAMMQNDKLPDHQSLACHAAVAGFSRESLRPFAVPMLLVFLQARSGQGISLDGEFIRRLYRHLGKNGDRETLQKRLDEYLAVRQGQNARYSGDYGLFQQQQDLGRTAQVAASCGLTELALDYIGRANDIPAQRYGQYGGEKPLYAVLRQLAKRSPEDRYALLSAWTLPAENRKLVRLEVAWNRRQYLPPLFTDNLDSNATALAGATLSNFEFLVDAAHACGKLDELSNRIKAAVAEDVPNAKLLQAYVSLKQDDIAAATPMMKESTSSLEKRAATAGNANRSTTFRGEYLLARTACEQMKMEGLGLDYARILFEQSKNRQQDILPHLRIAEAHRQVADAGLPPLATGDDPGLSFWHPFSSGRSSDFAYPSWWIPVDGHVVHISGIAKDLLNVRFPIVGDFEFSIDAYCNSWAEGNIGYAGIVVEGLHLGGRSLIYPVDEHEQIQRPDIPERSGDYNRVTIQQKDGKVRFLVNRSLAYEETAGKQSPWLNLMVPFSRRSAFRNPRFSGSPIIPREISLIDGNRMDGWLTSYFNETQPRRRLLAEPESEDENIRVNRARDQEPSLYDWEARDGELIGNRKDDLGIDVQSRIRYFRPLQPKDRIHYEFLYEPGQTEIHPALGKVSFLLQPDGVKLHWITDSNWDAEVFGIEPSNLIDDPAATKSKGPLPLKPGEWNTMDVAYLDETFNLTLNGQKIYQCSTRSIDEAFFGFFRYKDQTAARVRNIVLTGDWPEKFPAEMLSDSFALKRSVSGDEQLARHASVGDHFHHLDAPAVWRHCLGLPLDERYRYLADWVIPNAHHPFFRLFNFPFPVGRESEIPVEASVVRLENGSLYAAPCWELLSAAQRLNRLGELRDVVTATSEQSAMHRRGKLALLLMIAAAANDPDAARDLSLKLQTDLSAISHQLPEWERYPEYTATLALVNRPDLNPIARELTQKQIDKYKEQSNEQWAISKLSPVVRTIEVRVDKTTGASPQLTQWHSGSILTSRRRVTGKYPTVWLYRRGLIEQFPAETVRPLFFQSPMTGEFEVTADFSLLPNREAVLGYSMSGISPYPDRKGVHTITLLKGDQRLDKEFPAGSEETVANIRLVVKNRRVTWFVNGVEMTSGPLTDVPDPWLAIQGRHAYSQSTIRNLRILGNPTIPDSINLSMVSDLINWRADEYGDRIGPESDKSAEWFQRGDELVGRLRKDRSIPDQPCLIVHQRPLTFDGELTYEFFYKPNEFEVYPAFGRTCWFISPDGIRRRQLNDAVWELDDTVSSIGGVKEVAATGSAPKLKTDDWNTVLLTWRGNDLTISVNDQEITRDEIEAGNTRQFGLFRYSERQQSRVRNVILKGDWPKALPVIADQELAIP
jgi:predicted Zn-dependent protease